MRPSGRPANKMREVSLETRVSKHAEGSCLACFGDTHVFCTASLEDHVPHWLRNNGRGWITAEYGMLPRSTSERTGREAVRGRQSGRTQEIQRLIGRSLRAIVDLELLGERQIRIDCDVLQADGGTSASPINDQVAAISCGIYNGNAVLDLDYAEDSNADTDANFVITGTNLIIEVQGTAETQPFSREKFSELLDLAEVGIAHLIELQRKVLSE